jgi:two-component system sensor kinase FixL
MPMFTEAPGEFQEIERVDAVPPALAAITLSLPTRTDYGIVTTDAKGVVLSCNASAASLFGYEITDVVGHSITMLMRTEDAGAHAGRMAAFRETGKGNIVGTGRIVVGQRIDGTNFEMDLVISESAVGGERIFTGVMRDISRRRAATNQIAAREAELTARAAAMETALAALQAKSDDLEESNSELEQFAYVASHDLQEPLRKIQAFGTRLVSTDADNLSERGRDYLSRMENAAARMQVLINDLLKFARVSTSGRELVPEKLGTIVGDVLEDLEVAISSAGATVAVPEHLPTVLGDAVQLRQVFQNLLGNALKFCVPGRPPIVKISVAQEADETIESYESGVAPQEWLRITVEDNGIGFDPQYADRIFGTFQRLNVRTEYPGTGVGLAVCKKIIDRHDGSIAATVTVDEGARFTIRLPMPRL